MSLDSTKQKQLMTEQPSASSSSTSLNSLGRAGAGGGGSSTLGRGGKASRQMSATSTRSASRGVESSGINQIFLL